MDSSTPSTSTQFLAEQPPFGNWAECRKALKNLPFGIDPQIRERFITRIIGSPQRHHIAFEILFLLLDKKNISKIQWIEKAMLKVLSDGVEQPALSPVTVSSQAGKWVGNELHEIDTIAKWKQFVSEGKHFWLLYAILRTSPNTHVLIESLTAFIDSVEKIHNKGQTGKVKKYVVRASDAIWITKLLKSKIPAKYDLPKSFLETVFAIYATAALSEDVRIESAALRAHLKTIEEELAIATKAMVSGEQRERDLQVKLDATAVSLDRAKKELSDEKLHAKRQGGFNVVAKQETINHVVSIVRQKINHRLENIRGYADREKPNRDEILALVEEIEKHLSRLEDYVAQ
jgi:hypothetical protein